MNFCRQIYRQIPISNFPSATRSRDPIHVCKREREKGPLIEASGGGGRLEEMEWRKEKQEGRKRGLKLCHVGCLSCMPENLGGRCGKIPIRNRTGSNSTASSQKPSCVSHSTVTLKNHEIWVCTCLLLKFDSEDFHGENFRDAIE